jgi:hypothetical protein
MSDSSPFLPIIGGGLLTSILASIGFLFRKLFHLKGEIKSKPSVKDMEKKIKESSSYLNESFKKDFINQQLQIITIDEKLTKVDKGIETLTEQQTETGKITANILGLLEGSKLIKQNNK